MEQDLVGGRSLNHSVCVLPGIFTHAQGTYHATFKLVSCAHLLSRRAGCLLGLVTSEKSSQLAWARVGLRGLLQPLPSLTASGMSLNPEPKPLTRRPCRCNSTGPKRPPARREGDGCTTAGGICGQRHLYAGICSSVWSAHGEMLAFLAVDFLNF